MPLAKKLGKFEGLKFFQACRHDPPPQPRVRVQMPGPPCTTSTNIMITIFKLRLLWTVVQELELAEPE